LKKLFSKIGSCSLEKLTLNYLEVRDFKSSNTAARTMATF
jgi:hypothetical protein